MYNFSCTKIDEPVEADQDLVYTDRCLIRKNSCLFLSRHLTLPLSLYLNNYGKHYFHIYINIIFMTFSSVLSCDLYVELIEICKKKGIASCRSIPAANLAKRCLACLQRRRQSEA